MLGKGGINVLQTAMFKISNYCKFIQQIKSIFSFLAPVRTPWGLSNTSSVSPACRKRRLNGAVCRNHRIKRVVPCRCRSGTLKNPVKCLWRWEPDRRYNFFFSPPGHLCCTYMTEISLHELISIYHICPL